jgi:hypothetical protein
VRRGTSKRALALVGMPEAPYAGGRPNPRNLPHPIAIGAHPTYDRSAAFLLDRLIPATDLGEPSVPLLHKQRAFRRPVNDPSRACGSAARVAGIAAIRPGVKYMIDQIVEEPVPPPDRVPTGPGEDLSGRIEQAVVRRRHDRVRCVRVFGDFYRCNWWALATGDDMPSRGDRSAWGAAAMSRVRESRFLRATLDGDVLKIDEPALAADVDPT